MATRFLDLIKFYDGDTVVCAVPRDTCRSATAVYVWLAGDQGMRITRVERALTEVVYNPQTGITYLPDGRKVDEDFVTVY